jgi:glycosyltransferase involved in cell wall biosynthesis
MVDQNIGGPVSSWQELSQAPVVSVYMLAYRHVKFIAQAIEGVISQQCEFPFELIIGEDFSDDGTLEVALEYQRRYPNIVRVLHGSSNVGAHENARRCLLACRGEFVAMCEGDDYWHHPRKLQMQVDLMRAQPEISFCHTDFDRRTRYRLRKASHRAHGRQNLAHGAAYPVLLRGWSVVTATAMFRRDVLLEFVDSEFNKASWPFGDRNKQLFASLRGPVGYIGESTATFRKRMGSINNSGAKARLNLLRASAECIELFMARHPVDDTCATQAREAAYRLVYDAAFRAGDLRTLDSSFLELRACRPNQSRTFHAIRRMTILAKFPVLLAERLRMLKDRFLSAM